MNETLVKILGDIAIALSPLFVALLSWASATIARKVSETTKGEVTRNLLLKLNDIVWHVVLELEQTIVAGLREANADGKITEEEIKKIKKMALQKIRSFISFQEIAKVLGFASEENVEEFVQGRIESSVMTLKKSTLIQNK